MDALNIQIFESQSVWNTVQLGDHVRSVKEVTNACCAASASGSILETELSVRSDDTVSKSHFSFVVDHDVV